MNMTTLQMKMNWRNQICIACASLMLVACGSKKVLTESQTNTAETNTPKTESSTPAVLSTAALVEKVMENQVYSKNIVGNMNFDINVNGKELSVPGSVHMRKDEVVRIQLFIPLLGTEIGRLEFTPEYVLVIDRLHKEYVQADYNQLEFLKNNGLNFYSMQSLFWNELALPGEKQLTKKDYNKYKIDKNVSGTTMPLMLKNGNMQYTWQVDKEKGQISNTSVNYTSASHGSSDLIWDYSDFTAVGVKQFPTNQHFKFSTTSTGKKKSIEVNIKMKSVKTDDDWTTKTTVSDKYKKVQPNAILGKLLGM